MIKRTAAGVLACLCMVMMCSCGQSSDPSMESIPQNSVALTRQSTSAQPDGSVTGSTGELPGDTEAAASVPGEGASEQQGSSSPDTSAVQEVQNDERSEEAVVSATAAKSRGSVPQPSKSGYRRAVWISQFEDNADADGRSAGAYKSKIDNIMSRCAANGINTVIVQVRPYSDAYYNSGIFPATKYLSGTQGVAPGFDALSIITSSARANGLRIEAWVNPFRVATDTDFGKLAATNPARVMYEQNPQTESLIICSKGIYYNPSDAAAQKLIIDGVREILNNYDVDGIHFDDYFYPETQITSDAAAYERYTGQGGTLSLGDWRRKSLSGFIAGVHNAVKACGSGYTFGVSCSSDTDRNYSKLYADIEGWCASGYLDYVMPQIYFGFNNSAMPFEEVLNNWSRIAARTSTTLYAGLAPYKSGKEDKYAGDGKYEWTQSTDIIARQVSKIHSYDEYSGYCFFSYSYIFSENASESAKKELKNYRDMIE